MPPKVQSDVWKHFSLAQNKTSATCTLCNKELAYSGGTSNLRNHLKLHPRQLPIQTKLSAFTASSPQKPLPASQTEKITQAIADMIVEDYLPLSIVEGDGFRRLMAIVAPSYTVASRPTIRARIVRRYEGEREKLITDLHEVPSVAITTDTWTSNSTESYLTVTSHHVTDNWKMESNVLMTRAMPERHTGENLANRLKEAVSEFGVGDKVESCVHDNARNIVNAGNRCEDWGDLSCFGHTLQLCVKPALELPQVSSTLGRCRKLVGHFRHSTTLTAELNRRQLQKGKNTALTLVQDVPTRWNSSYDMMSRLIELRSVVTDIMLDSSITKKSESSLLLKDTDWETLDDLCSVLRAFKDTTTYMSGDLNVSVSEILPIVHGLRTNEVKVKSGDSRLLVKVKETLADELDQRFQPSTAETAKSVPALASLLDPRYKRLQFLPRHLRAMAEEQLEQRLDEVPLRVGSRDDDDAEPHAKRPRLDFLVFSPDKENDDELRLYLADRSVDQDPLDWWRRNETKFPRVAYVAKRVLGIPATSVPSERIFSSAGLILNKLRNRLSSDIVDKIIFLNKNSKVNFSEENEL